MATSGSFPRVASWRGVRRQGRAGRCGRDRHNLWRIAYASAREVDSHLRLLAHAGAVDGTRAAAAIAAFDEVRAMTWRLLHPEI